MAWQNKTTAIFGCGNVIMGDDGFGSAVIEALESRYSLPQWVVTTDAGTGLREYLFDYLLLAEGRPNRLIIIDAVDVDNRVPGEVFFIEPGSIPDNKIHDFSLHQFPTVNLLHELEQYTGIEVKILAGQVEYIPDEISPGLSCSMSKAVPIACDTIVQLLSGQC